MNKKKNYNLKKIINNSFSMILLSFVIILFLLIVKKVNPDLTKNIKTAIFDKSFNFIKVNSLTKKVFGKEFIYQDSKNNSLNVFNDELDNTDVHKYYDGEKFQVSNNLPIGIFESGVVVYSGFKENFNNTVIIQGIDGYNIWYGNLNNIGVSLYDYVEKNSLIGSADGNFIYILIEKDSKFYSYDEYKKNKN